MRARGRGMTWWARTAQKSGSRLLPNAAVPVWLSSALRTSAMAPEKNLETGAPWVVNHGRPTYKLSGRLSGLRGKSVTAVSVGLSG